VSSLRPGGFAGPGRMNAAVLAEAESESETAQERRWAQVSMAERLALIEQRPCRSDDGLRSGGPCGRQIGIVSRTAAARLPQGAGSTKADLLQIPCQGAADGE